MCLTYGLEGLTGGFTSLSEDRTPATAPAVAPAPTTPTVHQAALLRPRPVRTDLALGTPLPRVAEADSDSLPTVADSPSGTVRVLPDSVSVSVNSPFSDTNVTRVLSTVSVPVNPCPLFSVVTVAFGVIMVNVVSLGT